MLDVCVDEQKEKLGEKFPRKKVVVVLCCWLSLWCGQEFLTLTLYFNVNVIENYSNCLKD